MAQPHIYLQVGLKVITSTYETTASCFSSSPVQDSYSADFVPVGKLLSRWNKGFCLNGTHYLTIKESFRHILVIGNSGSVKSSTVLLSSIYNAKKQSPIIHDSSGELLIATAAYLTLKGYKVKVLHYSDPTISCTYNPIKRANTLSEIYKLSNMLVRISLGSGGKDAFWNTQAASFIALVICILKKQNELYHNFANMKYLVEQYQAQPEFVDRLVAKAADEEILRQYKVFLKTDSKVMANIISTCKSALQIFMDPSVQQVTATDTIDFEEFRKEKVALFIQNKTADMKYYASLTSILIEQLLAYLMSKIPPKGSRPIFFLLDETSSLYLPDTLQIALSNLRKFSCGLMLVIQDFNQLKNQYGTYEAEAIKTNTYAQVIFPGADVDTCKTIEILLGKREFEDKEGHKKVRLLLSADEIRVIDKKHALLFVGANRAIYARMRPFYKRLWYWLYSKRSMPEITGTASLTEVQLLKLK